ncbi:recombinase family protein [Jannaschia rubra]|uniref:recombinase family protein n=1 Tax=Jannaschia rubra TaxID=282197 RepID=UPI002492BA87|nr:recombinase family protein [Jannaschia rubra]
MNMQDKRKLSPGTKAIVYCRVSDTKQTTRGDGLNSQETRCREFAKYKGYEVVAVFKDDMSGRFHTRPGMQEALSFLRKHRKSPHVLIIDDITRLARGLEAHIKLRADINGAGGILESPSIEFGEDSDSILVENLLASVSQHQRQKNGEQTKNRMRARLQNGYWPFQAPIGYRYERCNGGHGKVLVRDEPNASILQEALEGYASGRFQTQVEVKRFLERQPAFPKDLNGREVRNQRAYEFLTRPLYAGYVEHADWGVSIRKGQHEGLIDYTTFQRIQERLTSTAKAPARKDISADFPLRGFIHCDDCGTALTACWSTSNTGKKHPYYLCKTKGCESYRKSIRRDQLEEDFEELLQALEPSKGLFEAAKVMFRDIWDGRLALAGESTKALKKDIQKIERQIETMLDRIVESSTGSVVAAFEKRIAKLEAEKILLEEQVAKSGKPQHTLEESFELALAFLSSPWNLWKNGPLAWQRTVLRLAFAEPVRYCRSRGVRTPKISFPFKVLRDISTAKSCRMPRISDSFRRIF